MQRTSFTTKFRTVVVILLLAVVMNISAPKPANAVATMIVKMVCVVAQAWPVFGSACESQAAAALAQAIDSVIMTAVRAFVTQVDIAVNRGLARGTMMNISDVTNQENRYVTARDGTPGATRGRCAINTVATVGGTGVVLAPGERAPRPRTRVRRGQFPSVELDGDQGVPLAAAEQNFSEQASDAIMRRQRNPDGPVANAIRDHEATRKWRCDDIANEAERTACQEEAQTAGARPYADVNAESLFGADTFDAETIEVRETRADEALAYCVNLMVPGTPTRPGGSQNADRVIADAVQRAGDARIALAVKACTDAAARRIPITFNAANSAFNWIKSAACAYRRAFNNQLNLEDTEENENFRTVIDDACDGGASHPEIRLSPMELKRVMARDIFTSPQFTIHTASSNPPELQRMLVAMESINAQLNYDILRMQEQITLIQAARLAASIGTR